MPQIIKRAPFSPVYKIFFKFCPGSRWGGGGGGEGEEGEVEDQHQASHQQHHHVCCLPQPWSLSFPLIIEFLGKTMKSQVLTDSRGSIKKQNPDPSNLLITASANTGGQLALPSFQPLLCFSIFTAVPVSPGPLPVQCSAAFLQLNTRASRPPAPLSLPSVTGLFTKKW